MVMTHEDCIAHGKKHSKTWVDYKWEKGQKVKTDWHFDTNSPWAKEEDIMCLKTVFIQLTKLLPASVELQQAISADETSREYKEGIFESALEIPAKEDAPAGQATNGQAQQKPVTVAGGITEAQTKAVKELAKKRYPEKWDAELLNRIGSAYGVETLAQITEKQAEELIRALSQELADA
jgi:recombination protein RecT